VIRGYNLKITVTLVNMLNMGGNYSGISDCTPDRTLHSLIFLSTSKVSEILKILHKS